MSGRVDSVVSEYASVKANFAGVLVPGLAGHKEDKRTTGFFHELVLGYDELFTRQLWNAVLIEFTGTFLFMIFHVYSITSVAASGVENASMVIGFINGAFLAVLIYAFANSSGAHFNPNISMATVLTGHTPIVRGVVYIIFQTIAAITAARFVYTCDDNNSVIWGSCVRGNLNPFQSIVMEMFMTMPLVIIAYGCAFDKGQAALYGPIFAPMAIAITLMIVVVVSAGVTVTSGYTWGGNPAFCAGAAVGDKSNGDANGGAGLSYVSGLLMSMLHAVLYSVAPPVHKEDEIKSFDECDSIMTKEGNKTSLNIGGHA